MRGTENDASAPGGEGEQTLMPRAEAADPAVWSEWPPPTGELAEAVPGYQIISLLGSGGMGAVYRATQLNLDRVVAIKLLPPHLGADGGFRARFRREARAMARLNHPNIVQIHDYGETAGGLLYFVMEMVDGSDLHRLVRAGQVDVEGTLIAVSQICQALQYAHERGFVHRDIKPANVFVNLEGLVKVGDFGLAKLVELPVGGPAADDDLGLTVSGVGMGTPGYAAPEQMLGKAVIDHRADLYSLGVMFYEMLTRELPRGAPRAPSWRIAELDVRIDGIVFRAMDPDPEGRYQTAEEMRCDVETVRTTPACLAVEEEDGDLQGDLPGAAVVSPAWPVMGHGQGGGKEPEHLALLQTTRSLNATTLLLGMMALLTLGALAFFLASRKTGDVTTIETSTKSTQVTNSYFPRLVADGVATAGDLASVTDLGSDGSRFIAVSRQALSFPEAEALAVRVGAAVLNVDPDDEASHGLLAGLIGGAPDQAIGPEVWVLAGGEPHLFDGKGLRDSVAASLERRVLLQWTPGAGGLPAGPADARTALAEELAAVRNVPSGDRALSPAELQPSVEVMVPPEPESMPGPPPPASGAAEASPLPGTEAPEVPNWTNLEGVTIEGEFVRLDGAAVVIRRHDRTYTIPFRRLSAASVSQAKKLGGLSP